MTPVRYSALLGSHMFKRISLLNFLLLVTIFFLSLPYLIRLIPQAPIDFSVPVADGGGGFPWTASYFVNKLDDGSHHGTYRSLQLPNSSDTHWCQGDGNPPLTAKAAVELAIAMQRQDYPRDDIRDWRLVSAALMPVLEIEGKWVWLITFHNANIRSVGQTERLSIAVDMDGKTYGPNR